MYHMVEVEGNDHALRSQDQRLLESDLGSDNDGRIGHRESVKSDPRIHFTCSVAMSIA